MIAFQKKVAESVFTLPVCIAVAVAFWWLPERDFSLSHILGLVLCLLTTCIIMETNARQHIIRIRTRLMSCVWLVLATALPFMHSLGTPIVAAFLLSVSYLLLFHCYQHPQPQRIVFHVFLMLGMGCFCTPIMPLMAIPFFVYLIVFLRTMNWKTFWAGVLGLATPYWCYAIWLFLTNDMQDITTILHLSPLTPVGEPVEPHPSPLTPVGEPVEPHLSPLIAAFAFPILVGIIHFFRTKYNDKIRVRMILYIYVCQTSLLMVFLLLQPTHYSTTLSLLAVSTSPLIAHYFALTNSLASNIFFILTLLLTATTIALNLTP